MEHGFFGDLLIDDDVRVHPRRAHDRQHPDVEQLGEAPVAMAPASQGTPRAQGAEAVLHVHPEEARNGDVCVGGGSLQSNGKWGGHFIQNEVVILIKHSMNGVI